MNQNTAVTYVNSAKYPIRFDKLHPGSLFRIVAEPERGIYQSRDTSVYRKAQEHEGFFATVEGDKSKPACLYPTALVQPVRKERA